jgi:hypothetical protein
MNSPIRTSAIGLLQHLQLLYLPSELDIDEQIQPVTLPFYCMQYHPVTPTRGMHPAGEKLSRKPFPNIITNGYRLTASQPFAIPVLKRSAQFRF